MIDSDQCERRLDLAFVILFLRITQFTHFTHGLMLNAAASSLRRSGRIIDMVQGMTGRCTFEKALLPPPLHLLNKVE